jgi:hypothetical protein
MAAGLAAVVPLIEGLGGATAATAGTAAAGTAAAAAGTAAAATLPEIAVTSTAIGAGTAAAAGAAAGGAVAGGALAAANAGGGAAAQPSTTSAVMRTVSQAATVAAGASAIYQLANQPRIQIPPSPTTGPGQIDQSVAAAEADAERRRASAGGLQSTIGTGAGQAGAVLNPGTLSQHGLLGG